MIRYGGNTRSTCLATQPIFTGESRREKCKPDGRKRYIIVAGVFFRSIHDAAVTVGIKEDTLSAAVRKRAWKCKGHLLMYT